MNRASVVLIALVGMLSIASPADAWESDFIVNNEERVCLLSEELSALARLVA